MKIWGLKSNQNPTNRQEHNPLIPIPARGAKTACACLEAGIQHKRV